MSGNRRFPQPCQDNDDNEDVGDNQIKRKHDEIDDDDVHLTVIEEAAEDAILANTTQENPVAIVSVIH